MSGERDLTDDEKIDLAARMLSRLPEVQRQAMARRVLEILYRQGKASAKHLRDKA